MMFLNNYINPFHKLINFMIGITSFALRCSQLFENPEIVFCDEYSVPSFQEVDNDGVISRQMVFKTQKFSDYFSKLKVSDFSLSNIMAIGATQLLKPVQFSPDALAASDALTSGAESILDAMSNSQPNE